MSNIYFKKIILYSLIILIFVFLFFNYYYGIFKFGYLVPPGDDGTRHMTETKYIIQNGYYDVHPGSADPPLFHILLAVLTYLTGSNLAATTIFFAPLLTILSISSIYFISKRYFNYKIAFIAFLMFVFISPNLFGIYQDGTYLDLISAEFFLVFMLSFIPLLFNKKIKPSVIYKNLLLIIIFAGSTILSHSLSTVYLIMIMSIFLIILLAYYYKNTKQRKTVSKSILLLYPSILIFLLFTWNYYFKSAFSRLLGFLNLLGNTQQANITIGNDIFFSIPPAFNNYIKAYSLIIILLATGGFILFIFSFIFKHKFYKRIINLFSPYNQLINFDNNILTNKKYFWSKIILIIWGGILLIGSRFSFFIYPSRLVGDATIPVCILAAIFIYFIVIIQNKYYKKVIIISLLVIFISFFALNKISQATEYEKQVRIQNSDEQAIEWINNNTKKDDIILAIPRTIVNPGWGSYLNLLTDRKVLDGSTCSKGDDKLCDPIYNPNSQISLNYYQNNNINYVYAGKKIMGEFVWKNSIDWNYQNKLSKASFLEKIVEFKENKELGSVIIFKVNNQKLNDLLSSY